MTLEEIQKAALEKVFSRTNYGVEVALDSADVADYVKAMPKAARFAMIDLAEVMPIYRSVEQELPERADGYRLFRVRELAPDFMRLCPDRLTVMGKSNTFRRINDYQFDGDDLLYVPGRCRRTLTRIRRARRRSRSPRRRSGRCRCISQARFSRKTTYPWRCSI